MSVSEQLKKVRKHLNLTQHEFAEKVGVSITSLQRYETNTRQPTIEVLNKIASALNIGVEKLLFANPENVEDTTCTMKYQNAQ